MHTIYWLCLAVGGTLVALTLFSGFDFEVDVDHDFDHDLDPDVDTGGFSALALDWLPIVSVRFWAFFLAFFGLIGVALSKLDPASMSVPVPWISAGGGYLVGVSAAKIMRFLKTSQVDSSVGADDYLGATGVVEVAIEPGKPGKVRLHIKGRTVEAMAHGDDESIGREEAIVVYRVDDEGSVYVSKIQNEEEIQ